LSGAHGGLLELQTKFVNICVKQILTFYKNVKPIDKQPKSVVIIGHSMGGVISRGILLNSDNNGLVTTIITQATPHLHPVITIDSQMYNYYQKINQFWTNITNSQLDNVTLLSIYGGTRDFQVRNGLANMNDWIDKSPATIISAYAGSIPFVWKNIDHLCIAWCRELVLATNRALFQMIDNETLQISTDSTFRKKIFEYHFKRTATAVEPPLIHSLNISDTIITKSELANFEFNGYNDKKRLVLIDLNLIFDINNNYESKGIDSLFIYTNINEVYSFTLCQNVIQTKNELFECTNPLDLNQKYGRP
jgi:GPI inositol-deacylase